MATLNEIAYDIANQMKSGLANKDLRLSIDQIKFIIKTLRVKLIRQDLEKGREPDQDCYQNFAYVSLATVDKADLPILLGVTTENIKRTTNRVPDAVYVKANFHNNNYKLIHLTHLEKGQEIPIYTPVKHFYSKYDKYASTMAMAYPADDYYYISNYTPTAIGAFGVFRDPEIAYNFGKLSGYPEWTDDMRYPISDESIRTLKNIFDSSELPTILGTIRDEQNDQLQNTGASNQAKQSKALPPPE